MDDVDCLKVREALWPPERPRLATEDVVRMREHLSGCPECRDYFRQDEVLLELYDRLRDRKAPRELRDRIFDIVARERTGTSGGPERAEGADAPVPDADPDQAPPLHRRAWARGIAGAVAAAAVVFGVLFWPGSAPERGAPSPGADRSLYVEDYLRRAVGQDRIETSNPGEVAEFLQRELAIAFTPMKLEGLKLTGAEICLLEGRRGAMILYDAGGATLSHYVVPVDGVGSRPPAPATRLEEPTSGARGPGVVTWSTPSLQQALVGPLRPDRLLTLARRAASG